MHALRLGHILATLLFLTAFSSAWPWPPSLDSLGGLIHRRQDSISDSDNQPTGTEPAKAKPTQTGKSAPKTADGAPEVTGSPTATSGEGKKKKGKETKAAKTGSAKATKEAASKTVDQRLPPGGVNLITPSALAQTTYYKVGDYVEFAWNYTSLSVKPSMIDMYVTCQANSMTYAISNNVSFEPTGRMLWDTKPDASGTAALLTETYTLVVHDAAKDVSDAAKAGHLGAFQTYMFGMYTPLPYTGLADGWKCATCSGAMSDMERQALKFMFGMCMITVLSFTWFVGGFGALF